MKLDLSIATTLAALSLTACKPERNASELLASVKNRSHMRAGVLTNLTIPQQEALLGPAVPTAKRVRALVAPTDLTLGPVDAPVVLIAFVDFDGSDGDAVGSLLAVQQKHPLDVRIAVKPLSTGTPASEQAAEAIIAGAAQGKGWEIAKCASRADRDPTLGIAVCTATLDLDMPRYTKDLVTARTTLAENTVAGGHLVVTQAPTLFLNGYRVKGVPPAEQLERAVAATITHAWKVAGAEHLERDQIYPELMRTASIPTPPTRVTADKVD